MGKLSYKQIFVALLVIVFAVTLSVTIAQDATPPVTTKTYGDPNAVGMFEIPSCYGQVPVNVHFISTGTTITLDATDEDSGVNRTLYVVYVPTGCQEGDFEEWVGSSTHNIYESQEECYDDGNDNCVLTTWELKEEIMNESQTLLYTQPFVIPHESIHKICYWSVDNAENVELPKCQIAVVDDTPPQIFSAEVDHPIIDLQEYSDYDYWYYTWYYEYYSYAFFSDPKCTLFTVNASDTHDIDDVQINVSSVLQQMYQDAVDDFNSAAYAEYLADDMHNTQSADFNEGTGLYEYWFCPSVHIQHLYSEEYPNGTVVNTNDELLTIVEEKLVLGEFEVEILVNDTVGFESTATVDLTITDLTVPLEEGWNLRSTPIALEGDEFFANESVDVVLSWDSSTQSWKIVTDNNMEPLEAVYIHSTGRTQYGIVFERDLTAPPLSQLNAGWNLVGPALPFDEDQFIFGYSNCPDTPGGYSQQWCTLSVLTTYLYDWCESDAFGSLVYDQNGNRALEAILAPYWYLDYGDDWNWWYFETYNNEPWVWIPEINEQGADPDNTCYNYIQNFAGYWIFMQNSDLLPGFTTTPLQFTGYYD